MNSAADDRRTGNMFLMTSPNRRVALAAILSLAACTLSGCQLSREQQLMGRWYNSNVSIRFRPDGSVLLNTEGGRAVGRYYFDGSVRRQSSDKPRENLVLDVVRNNERLRMSFEIEMISATRLRMYDLSNGLRVNRRGDTIEFMTVLKRADENDTKTASL
jgi:hypothetical protein